MSLPVLHPAALRGMLHEMTAARLLTFLLASFTVLGGAFVSFIPLWLSLLLILAVLVAGAGVVAHKLLKISAIPASLTVRAFALRPRLAYDQRHFDGMTDVAKASLFLLLADRVDSSCWGWSYLYRVVQSGRPVPFSRGSLGGTPLGVWAICSLGMSADARTVAYGRVMDTLSSALTDDGEYVLGKKHGQFGDSVEYEPQRHAAGAVLLALWYGHLSRSHLRVISRLCNSSAPKAAWDCAIVSRVLMVAAHCPELGRSERAACWEKANNLLGILAKRDPGDRGQAFAWLERNNIGLETVNMWAAVWAVLPYLTLPYADPELASGLRGRLVDMFRAHASAGSSRPGFMPNVLEPGGAGSGMSVFGTAIAVLGWRVLEETSLSEADGQSCHAEARRLLDALCENPILTVLEPSMHPESQPLALEGYVSWGALCLAAACTGVSFDQHTISGIEKLVDRIHVLHLPSTEIGQSSREKLSKLMTEIGLFPHAMHEALITASMNLGRYEMFVSGAGRASPVKSWKQV